MNSRERLIYNLSEKSGKIGTMLKKKGLSGIGDIHHWRLSISGLSVHLEIHNLGSPQPNIIALNSFENIEELSAWIDNGRKCQRVINNTFLETIGLREAKRKYTRKSTSKAKPKQKEEPKAEPEKPKRARRTKAQMTAVKSEIEKLEVERTVCFSQMRDHEITRDWFEIVKHTINTKIEFLKKGGLVDELNRFDATPPENGKVLSFPSMQPEQKPDLPEDEALALVLQSRYIYSQADIFSPNQVVRNAQINQLKSCVSYCRFVFGYPSSGRINEKKLKTKVSRFSLKYHPDRQHGCSERMKAINAAAQLLLSKQK